MFAAVSDYVRLARAGAVMARHDVIIPEAYRGRTPWLPRAARPGAPALPAGGGRRRTRQAARPTPRRRLGEAGSGVDQARPIPGDAARCHRRTGGERFVPP